MNWTEILEHWPELKRKIAKDHPDLDTTELEQSEQGRRQLLQLIEAKYGAGAPVAEEDLSEVVRDDEDTKPR